MKEATRFSVSFENVEKVNPLFSRASVRVLYKGLNRNNSHFSKESIDKALPSIFNIPIVGEFLQDKDNFGGHGGKLEITEDEIKFISTTIPYGLVPESANIYWESVTEKNGEINEYLVVDGAYLWTGRYEEISDLLNRSYGQSMEIEVINGDFSVIDGVETFDIKEFLFSALCILGVNKDGEGHVEPCFESANITAYSLNKDDFKKQFNQMVAELKFSLQEGGNEVEENQNVTVEESQQEEVVETVVDEQVETVEDNFEQVEEVVETAEESEEVTEEVAETEEEIVEEFDYKTEYEKVKSELDSVAKEFETVKEELVVLREFKANKIQEERNTQETELFSRFSAELTEEEIEQVKETASEFTLEQLEEKLFVMVGKKKATFSMQPKKEKQATVKVEVETKIEDEYNPYGSILSKYQK